PLGLDCKTRLVDLSKDEHLTPEFARLNPNKKVPVLVDGDFVLWESNAILLYLGRKFAPNRLHSEDPKVFREISQWLFFGKTTVDPGVARARFFTRFVPKENQNEKQLVALREASRAALQM